MKGLITRNLHVKYESPTTYGSRDMAKVKVDNRQTDKQTDKQTDRQTDRQTNRQTDRQDENNMPPIYRYGGIKITQHHPHHYHHEHYA